jgi:ssRNA-specific RNase YbeY (16S rRNA maturation enzyme)
MTKARIEVVVTAKAWRAAEPRAAALAKGAAVATLAHEAAPGAALAILLTDDAHQRTLNSAFRGKDVATNVLSFPAAGPAADGLGDIALAFDVCAREAAEQGKTLPRTFSTSPPMASCICWATITNRTPRRRRWRPRSAPSWPAWASSIPTGPEGDHGRHLPRGPVRG